MGFRSVIIVGLICFSSCKPTDSELINMSDITPSSDYVEQPENKEQKDHIDLKIERYFDQEKGIYSSVELFKSSLLPSRFGPDSTLSAKLVNEDDTLFYTRWVYTDSAKTMNAFYNWLDCYGKDCSSFFFGDEVRMQPDAFKIIIEDTAITYITSMSKIDFDYWDEFHGLNESSKWVYIIEQNARGKSRWYEFVEQSKIKYKR